MDFSWISSEKVATWIQAIINTVALFLIYWQLGQVKEQMSQSEEQARFQRSWEFVKFYQDEIRNHEAALIPFRENFDPLLADVNGEAYRAYVTYFYHPRIQIYILLNQLISLQQVDEQVLFGYLVNDFNRFVQVGITRYGQEAFKKEIGLKISLLLNTWAPKIEACELLYGANVCATGITTNA